MERAGRWLLELQSEVQADVVHLNGYMHAALDWQRPCVAVAHSCVLSWWRAVRGEQAPAKWNPYRDAVTAGLAKADAIVAPTHAMLDSLEGNYGVLLEGRVIGNCANPALFKPGDKQPFILTAGRWWDDAKNLPCLELAARGLSWPVVAAGDAPKESGSAIECLGRLSSSELSKRFAAASIYALPARYEPFGISILEAAMSACALVIGDIPSLRENWEGAALLVTPHDHIGLRRTLERLIDDNAMRAELSALALERARELGPTKMAESYLDLYSELISHHATDEALIA